MAEVMGPNAHGSQPVNEAIAAKAEELLAEQNLLPEPGPEEGVNGANQPRRVFVPSSREVDLGLTEYDFTPLPPPEAPPKFNMGRAVGRMFSDLKPKGVLQGFPATPIVLLLLTQLFVNWETVAFGVLLPDIKDEFGFDLTFLVLIGSIAGIVRWLIGPIIGWVADRRSRVKMLAIGNLVITVSNAATAFVSNIPGLATLRVTGAMGSAVSQPAGLPLLTDIYPERIRGRLFSFIFAAGAVGAMIGPLMAGTLGELMGWRFTIAILGIGGAVVSFCWFFVKEPKRGMLDRLEMGASQEVAEREQRPMSFTETWRAAAAIGTSRRIWYATPFLLAAESYGETVLPLYYQQEFGAGTFSRGVIFTIMGVVAAFGLMAAGPITDKLLAERPGRVFGIVGIMMWITAGATVGIALSPYLWLSVLIHATMAIPLLLVLPSMFIVMSMVTPARLRGMGMQTVAPWQLLGIILVNVIVRVGQPLGLRGSMLLLVPLFIIGSFLIGSATTTVEADIRMARAASMADEEAARARAAGGNKMIIIRDLDVAYDGTKVLFNVDFDVAEGEVVALLGTNGAGKSTLLRAIAGIQQASNGAIFLDGDDITHRPPHENARDGVVFMPGGRAIFPSLSVEDNLKTAAWMYRAEDEYVAKRTEEILDFFPILRTRKDQQAGTMSGGEQQMLALGQAFLMRPRLLMIDELSLGLAPAIVEQLLEIVRRINEQGTTVVLVEQSVNVALTVAERAVFMEKGEIRFDGPTRELLSRGDLLRSVFLGGATAGGGAFIASGGLLRKTTALDDTEVLRVEDVVVRYGGHTALDGAHLAIRSGEVVGIIGPNGAGKTTLFDVVSGYTKPDEGHVWIAGAEADELGPDARARLGLSRSFQNARLFPAMTVRESIAVALERRVAQRSAIAAAAWLPSVRKSERRVARRVDYLIDLLNLDAYADKFVSELSTGSRRMVDMACIMATEPTVLLLDEPSSGLAQSEVEVLGPVVRRLAKETGCGVVVIEHDMPLITALSDRLVAMELGTVLLEGSPQEVVSHPKVVQSYLGASEAVIGRSGSEFSAALVAAGLTGTPEKPTRRKRS